MSRVPEVAGSGQAVGIDACLERFAVCRGGDLNGVGGMHRRDYRRRRHGQPPGIAVITGAVDAAEQPQIAARIRKGHGALARARGVGRTGGSERAIDTGDAWDAGALHPRPGVGSGLVAPHVIEQSAGAGRAAGAAEQPEGPRRIRPSRGTAAGAGVAGRISGAQSAVHAEGADAAGAIDPCPLVGDGIVAPQVIEIARGRSGGETAAAIQPHPALCIHP